MHLEQSRSKIELSGGVSNFIVLKTTESGFKGFHKCPYTVLPEVSDRILATNVTCWWHYNTVKDVDFNRTYEGMKSIISRVFSQVYSESVQATVWVIATEAINSFPNIQKVKLSLPNLHHWEIDTSRFGLSNDHDIFVAVDEPHGIIEAEVHRSTTSKL